MCPVTLTGALSARPQETEEAAPSDASITIDDALADGESSDQRSSVTGGGWAPQSWARPSPGWAPSSFASASPAFEISDRPLKLRLSADTLKQCSRKGRQVEVEDEENDDFELKKKKNVLREVEKVLRDLKCTKLTLGEGQAALMLKLIHLQQALWQKVSSLKHDVVKVLEEVRVR